MSLKTKLSVEEMKQLVAAIDSADVFSLAEENEHLDCPDSAGAVFSVTMRGKYKRIYDDRRCDNNAPSLEELEKRIEKILNLKKNVH